MKKHIHTRDNPSRYPSMTLFHFLFLLDINKLDFQAEFYSMKTKVQVFVDLEGITVDRLAFHWCWTQKYGSPITSSSCLVFMYNFELLKRLRKQIIVSLMLNPFLHSAQLIGHSTKSLKIVTILNKSTKKLYYFFYWPFVVESR